MWTLPNLLTLARIVSVVPLVALIEARAWGPALAVYAVGAATDFLDGYLARRLDQRSEFGRFLDPLADKLIVMAALVSLIDARAIGGGAMLWATVAILAREFAVAGLREWMGPRGVVVHVSAAAKAKTATQLIAIGLLLAAPAITPRDWHLARIVSVAGGLALLLSAALAWASARDYFRAALWPKA